MEDLLGIEVDYLADGSIKLHQKRYIEKVVARFLPMGPLPHVQANSLPYSNRTTSSRTLSTRSLKLRPNILSWCRSHFKSASVA